MKDESKEITEVVGVVDVENYSIMLADSMRGFSWYIYKIGEGNKNNYKLLSESDRQRIDRFLGEIYDPKA